MATKTKETKRFLFISIALHINLIMLFIAILKGFYLSHTITIQRIVLMRYLAYLVFSCLTYLIHQLKQYTSYKQPENINKI